MVPILRVERQRIELLPELSPVREVLVQYPDELCVMAAFNKMRQLMHHYVFEAFHWFFRQFKVQEHSFPLHVT